MTNNKNWLSFLKRHPKQTNNSNDNNDNHDDYQEKRPFKERVGRHWNSFQKNMRHPRVKLVLFAVLLLWVKTIIAYYLDFSLGVDGWFQHLILWINPLATGLAFYGISLLFSNNKTTRRVLLLLVVLQTILLYGNIMYYREFSDFMTFKALFGSQNAGNLVGIVGSLAKLMRPHDIIYFLDIPILFIVTKKKLSRDAVSYKFSKRYASTIFITAGLLFAVNLQLADISRPQLLLRTFDRTYIVKYLGLNFFSGYDVAKTAHASQVRANADGTEMEEITSYIDSHQVEGNPEYYGVAKGKNVVVLHLESMQQFLIDYTAKDEAGNDVPVTPFLNSIYHSKDTFAFDNVFHQVGQGKSSDAELMMENSIFGLSQGSALSQYGSDNTFQAASSILKQNGGYTSAVFHGNVGSFWNRNDTYKAFGVDYFFDSNYYTLTKENSLEYGLKDKLFYRDSIPYLEQLQQPFYTKFITVSNHFPFPYDEENSDYPPVETGDETVNGYFSTVHYADEALSEFFDYMKESGLYDDTIFVFYGDHYGISNSRNKSLATVLPDADVDNWDDYDNAMLQRVPAMFYIPGMSEEDGVSGGISETYGGQIDMLPTLLHLLGIDTKDYIMFGHDLLATDRKQQVVFRNGNLVTPDYTVIGSEIYDTKTGELLTDLTEEEQTKVQAMVEDAQKPLGYSQDILSNDLLRFYQPEGLKAVDKTQYDYTKNLQRIKQVNEEVGEKNTSLLYKNNGETSLGLYRTTAPELESTIEAAKENSKRKNIPDYNDLIESSPLTPKDEESTTDTSGSSEQ
ncbi:MAG: LTA synthase family protein [Bavariicoccus seileri]|uniref:LTA synthase family protein n=1 Tax=Bavariicoccus seileri TaxID=549685 RepID=UPI003F9C8544